MKREWTWMIGALAAAVLTTAGSAGERGVFRAERAGWILGMYVGENSQNPFPFITAVEEKSEAQIKGVRPGDELIRFQSDEARPLSRVFEQYNDLKPGKEVKLVLRRGAQNLQVTLHVPKPPNPNRKPRKPSGTKPGEGEGAAQPKPKPRKPVVIREIPPED